MRVVLDTSALLSLASGNILDLAVASVNCVIPERVRAELLGLSMNNDFDGNLAKKVLDLLGKEITVIDSSKASAEGEVECVYLANELEDAEFLITDDSAALEKLEKLCKKPVRFSTMFLYAFCLKKKITKMQALQILERMRVKRNWKDNLIFEQAKILIEELR